MFEVFFYAKSIKENSIVTPSVNNVMLEVFNNVILEVFNRGASINFFGFPPK